MDESIHREIWEQESFEQPNNEDSLLTCPASNVKRSSLKKKNCASETWFYINEKMLGKN